VPAIGDLPRVGQGATDDLDARVLAQPRFQGVGRPAGQHVDPLVSLGVA
jgi:hypothetical protein